MSSEYNSGNHSADREEGLLIKKAIENFYADSTTENLLAVMNILRDSVVWIPCHAVKEESGENQTEESSGPAEADSRFSSGKTALSGEPVRLEPEIVQNSKGYFMPVFSSCEEMGEYGKRFSKIKKPFAEAILLAGGCRNYQLSGIVINAFSNPFSLQWDLLALIEESADP